MCRSALGTRSTCDAAMRIGTRGNEVCVEVDVGIVCDDVSSSKRDGGCEGVEGELDRVNLVGTFNAIVLLTLCMRERNDGGNGTEAALFRSTTDSITLGAKDTRSSDESSIGMLPRLRMLTMDSHCSRSDSISDMLLVASTTMTYTECSIVMK